MTDKELERVSQIIALAWEKSEPAGLDVPHERALYWAARAAYAEHAAGQTDKETGARMVTEAKRQYVNDLHSWKKDGALLNATTDFWVRLEKALNAYGLEPSRENADKLWSSAGGLRVECCPAGFEASGRANEFVPSGKQEKMEGM